MLPQENDRRRRIRKDHTTPSVDPPASLEIPVRRDHGDT